jgi:hypothetical protein
VARWRTSLLAALTVLVAAGCGQAAERRPAVSTTAARPTLAPVAQEPLRVEGTGFQPGEHVRVTAKAMQGETVETDADEGGAFHVTFRKVDSCDSVTVVAAGSKGSHAEFNLSQIVCRDS